MVINTNINTNRSHMQIILCVHKCMATLLTAGKYIPSSLAALIDCRMCENDL